MFTMLVVKLLLCYIGSIIVFKIKIDLYVFRADFDQNLG